MTFELGDIVLYGLNGVCRIKEIQEREQGPYYILSPVHKPRTTLMVPMNNETLVGRMRYVPAAEEVEKSIEKAMADKPEWINDAPTRKEHAKDVLTNGSAYDLLMLCRSFYQHKEYVLSCGKKSTSSDASILRSVQERIRDEFSIVFGIEPSEVDDFLWNKPKESESK